MTLLGLETSSYLPLVWNTPYTPGIWSLIRSHGPARCILHRDSIREASGYFSATNTKDSESKRWMYDPSFRARHLADTLTDEQLARLPFPSTAFALILGGSIWPAAKYLNYARHCGFLYCDLIDSLDFGLPKRQLLRSLADAIAERSGEVSRVFQAHLSGDRISIRPPARYSYWGRLYDGPTGSTIEVVVRDDPSGRLAGDFPIKGARDAFHYWMMLAESPRPHVMIVADTGFRKNAREAQLAADIPIVVAQSWVVGSASS
jgi:hypothetical protein